MLPAWKGRLITDIDRRAALDIVDDIHDRGKVNLARRVFGHLYRMFTGASVAASSRSTRSRKPRSLEQKFRARVC